MEGWASQHPASIVIIALAVVWTVVSVAISFAGGWHSLAARFHFGTKFKGSSWHWQTAQMRWIAAYYRCITVGASPEGLYVAPFFPFRLAHPPLFIPWNEITHSKSVILFEPMTCFQLGREQQIPFWVPEKLGHRIEQAAGNAWPAESLA